MSDRDAWEGVDLAAIWESSVELLQEQVNVIERTVVTGIECHLDLGRQHEAAREAHKLAGSLGTFGFDEGSRLARSLELALAATDVLSSAQSLDLSGLVVDLQREVARPFAGPENSPTAPSMDGGPPSMLVVGTDSDRQRRVIEAAAGQGLRGVSAATLGAARRLISIVPPNVVVVDMGVVDEDDMDAFLVEMAGRQPAISTVVLTDSGSMSGRVRAARAGAQAVLEQPVPPDAIVAAVSRLLARQHAVPTVLAVDDDRTFLVLADELLGAHGVHVETLDDAVGLWATLEEVEPDLLLLDNDMPDVDGISLCRAIRSDERWARLPIIFLSSSRSPEIVREMFASGADDFVAKSASVDDLVTRVCNRIQRSRVQTERPDVDLATGLLDAGTFIRDAARLLGIARQNVQPAVLAVAGLVPPDEPELAALGRLLHQMTIPEDAVGAWSRGRLGVLLYGITGPDAEIRLRQILQAARGARAEPATRAGVGLASFPEDGSDIRSLGRVAEAALERAQESAGDAIEVRALPDRARVEVLDVLVVDDDMVLATLLVHALSGAGMSVRWLADGAEAVQLLDDPSFRARVVLLDVGLPGLDGLSVLRHLAQGGKLGQTRVVMLTVRTNEREVLEALDLGAFDHVAKPFSLSVLIHRIRRAIEASQ